MKKIYLALFLVSGSIPLFSEETTVTTVTTVKTDGETATTADNNTENIAVSKKADANDPFRSQLAITRMLSTNDGLEKNSARIEERSEDLNIEQKYLLLNQYKKDGGLPFALNLVLGLGIGSFIQGDTAGGLTGLIGEIGSFALVAASSLMGSYGYYSGSAVGYIMMIGGVASYLGFRVYELVRPWTYAKEYNEKLEQSLKISVVVRPYLNLAETLGPSYGVGLTAYF